MTMDAHAILIACAAAPCDPAALALAGVMSSAFERDGTAVLPLRGLDAQETRRVFERWFQGADVALALDWCELARHGEPLGTRYDEVEDLVALFNDHADSQAGPADDANAIAHALACASLGDNHLWQDLRLPSRRELSALIGHWFPRLAAKNTHDMKWKKFFYKQLCEREELFICKAPSCNECSDYAHCFGPE